MNVKIGEKYRETRARLSSMVKDGTISALEMRSENHACYFCKSRINGHMRVLMLHEPAGDSEFYLDDRCYTLAKLFGPYDELPFSLN